MQFRNKKETPEQKEKQKFRQSAVWKKFRNYLKKKRRVDFITQKPLYTGFQVHHMDLRFENYKDLSNEDNYLTLNRQSHEICHEIYRYPWEMYLLRLALAFIQMDNINKKLRTPKQLAIQKDLLDLYDKYKEPKPQLELF